MRALLVTAGSRGDVAPFLALARHGVARGDEVHLAVTREARDDADRTGAVVHGLDGDFAALIAAQGTSPWTALRTYRTTMAPMLAAIERSAVAAALAAAPDVLLTHPKILTAGAIAARRGRPWVRAEIVPTLTPTRDFPAAGLPVPDVPALNPLTFRALAAGARLGERAARRRVERDIGPLPPGAAPTRTVVPVSPVLLPRPDDWPATTVVTGRWVDPPDGAAGPPDPELDDFLAAGDVHYAGFGSMARGDPRARARTIVDVLRARGARVLLVTGWGGLEVPDDLAGPDVLVRRAVDHASVLPRCAAALHHAGAGTAHAVVAAGVPSVPVPMFADQPFWARRLHAAGLAAPPVPGGRLTAARLDRALDALPPRADLAGPAARMAAEDGVGVAWGVLDDVAGLRRS